jgi:hypothetical protein
MNSAPCFASTYPASDMLVLGLTPPAVSEKSSRRLRRRGEKGDGSSQMAASGDEGAATYLRELTQIRKRECTACACGYVVNAVEPPCAEEPGEPERANCCAGACSALACSAAYVCDALLDACGLSCSCPEG